MNRWMKLPAVIALFILLPATVQAQDEKRSFDRFRESLYKDFNAFRSEVLSQYGKYLDSLWVEYTQFAGVERNPVPKPETVPAVRDGKPVAPPDPEEPVSPTPVAKPAVGDTPLTPPTPPTPPPAGVTPSASLTPPVPIEPDPDRTRRNREIEIPFYGLSMSIKDTAYRIPDNLERNNISALWDYMYNGGYHKSVIRELERLVEKTNLNDYLTFELVRNYVDAKFGTDPSLSRYALVHFLLANMGYDIRLAQSASGELLLLLPFEQMVYARGYLNIDNKKYFIFGDKKTARSEAVYTCRLPSDKNPGKNFDLRLKNFNLPHKPFDYRIHFGDITLTGQGNANIYPILYRYPQMPVAAYAQSTASSQMRADIVNGFKAALADDGKREAVEKLLHFVQNAFPYATDDAQFGFEKPFFFEEILYYPKCDCEDRAIFYSYLLFHVLGVENHLIAYPGHEATALTLPEATLTGTSYNHENRTFYISDPTYIGASTGLCMPEYVNVRPEIDYIYK